MGGSHEMIRFEVSTEIRRPGAEVFAYRVNTKTLPEANAIVEEAMASETPLRVGSTITGRARFLGRKIESVNQVTEYVVNQKFTQTSEKPFRLTSSNLFAAAEGGTKVTAILEGEPGGFFKIGEPILARIAK